MTPDAERRPAGNGTANTMSVGDSPIVSPLKAELTSHGVPMDALTVMALANDPFRVDSPANRRDGKWLADQIADLGIGHGAIHIRGLHYALVGRTLPDGLPSTPLKDSEKRSDAWTQATGVMQTEIDALAALQPDLLHSIAEQAIAPYYDFALHRRTVDATRRWESEANARLRDLINDEHLAVLKQQARDKLATLADEIRAIDDALRIDATELDLPEFTTPVSDLPEPDIKPLIDSRWSFPAQCAALNESKRYAGGDL